MSDFFDASGNRISDGLTARASDVNTLRDEVGSAFDLLPGRDNLNRGTNSLATDTGVVNAYVVTIAHITSYTNGLPVQFIPTNTNTAAATINVSGLGVKSIRAPDDGALVAGDIVAGVVTELRYSTTTGRFHVMSTLPSTVGSSSAAAASAAAAAASASAASTSASNASTSATNAASSASAASTSASGASTSATNASNSASAAATSETNAATSASTASTQASNASTSASAASTSATNAATSATTASTQASNASTSATNAAASAVAAAASAADAIASPVAAPTHSASSKTTPVDNDEIPLVDSAASYALKRLTWANLKAAIFSVWGALTTAGTAKTTPADADSIAICDSAASDATKKLTIGNLRKNVYTETAYTITDGAAFEIDPANGNVQKITLGANRTPKATNFASGQAITLKVADGTAYTITWTDGTLSPVWVGGSAPTLATTGYSVIVLWKDGDAMYGKHVGDVA